METKNTNSLLSNEKQFNLVLEQLNEQRVDRRFCDVILRVGTEQFYAHSNILSAVSPYFRAFLGVGQDNPRLFSQRSPQIIEFHIDGNVDNSAYSAAVAVIIEYIYTLKINFDPDITSSVQIIEIAKIMQLEQVVEHCNMYEKSQLHQNQSLVANIYKDAETQTSCLENKMNKENLLKANTSVQTDFKVTLESESKTKEKDTEETCGIKIPFKKLISMKKIDDSTNMSKTLPAETTSKLPTNGGNQTKRKLFSKSYDKQNISMNKRQKQKTEDVKKEEAASILKETLKILSHELNDNEHGEDAVKQMIKIEPITQNEQSEEKKILPKRKNRGKPPSKYVEHESESDGERLVMNSDSNPEDLLEEPAKKAPKLENIGHQCEVCPYNTSSTSQFRRHCKTHSKDVTNDDDNEYPYPCPKCAQRFETQDQLQHHAKKHLDLSNVCRFCDLEAENVETLVEHLKIHQKPKPYHCYFCEKKFKSRCQLDVHLPKHSDAKPFVCEICKTGFKWKHALKCHMLTHSSTKDHLCDVCGFSTAYKTQLKAHRLIHTGDTFKCDYPNCTFECIKRQSLKYHKLTHTQEKPHQCEICGQSFSLTKNLKRHSLLHSSARPYKCTFKADCNFATTRYDKLKEHLLKIHGCGQAPSKKFRLWDYPKSLVPPPEDLDEKEETMEVATQIPATEVIHIDASQVNLGQIVTSTERKTKVYIQQPGGQTYPVTLVASDFSIPIQLIQKLEN